MAPQLQAVVSLNHGPFVSSLGTIQQATTNAVNGMVYGFGGLAAEVMTSIRAFGLLGGAAYGMSNFLSDAVTVGAEFEQAMANVGSVTGLSRAEISKLGVDAGAAGAQLGFMATDTASALYSLGSAGLQSASDLKNVLVPALLLSGATQSDSRQATELLTATLKTYRLETGQATEVANLFSGAIASSPATMERLTNAMVYAGPAAASLGVSLQDTVGAVAAFHQAGLMGQMAGTAFRQVLLELVEAAAKTEGAISAALAGWKPGTEGLVGAIDRLNAAGITAEQVMDEFGKRAGPAMAMLMTQGADAVRELTARIVEQGDVQSMYSRQMDTVHGEWRIFLSLMDQVKQQAFVALVPVIRQVIDSLQNMVRVLPNLGELVLAAGERFGRVTVEILALVALFKVGGVLVTAISAVTAAFTRLNLQLYFFSRDAALAASGFIPQATGAMSAFGVSVSGAAAKVGILVAAFAGWKLGQQLREIDAVAKASDQIAVGFMKLTGNYVELDNSTVKSTASLRDQRHAMEKLRAETNATADAIEEITEAEVDYAAVVKALDLDLNVFRNTTESLQKKLDQLDYTISLAGDGTGEMSEAAKALHADLEGAVTTMEQWNANLDHARKFTMDQSLLMADLTAAYERYQTAAAAAMKALESGEVVAIAEATKQHENATIGLADALVNLQDNLGTVKNTAEQWVNQLQKAEANGEFMGDAVDTGRALAEAYKGIFQAAVAMEEAIATGSKEKIIPAHEAYKAALDKLLPAQQQHEQALKDVGAAAEDAADKTADAADMVEAMGKGLSVSPGQAGQFVRAMEELLKLSGKTFPEIPDYSKVRLPGISTGMANQFVSAMNTLSEGLENVWLPELPDWSAFKIPSASITAANNLVAAMKVLDKGLKDLVIALPEWDKFTIPAVSIQMATELTAAFKDLGQAMTSIAELPKPISLKVEAAIGGLDVSMLASESTLQRIANRLDSMDGSGYWR